MTWIETKKPTPENPELLAAAGAIRGLLPEVYRRRDDWRQPEAVLSDSIVLAHSLIPEALEHALSVWGALCRPELPLTRREQELIATVVSAANACFYCTESHQDFLRLETMDEALAEAVRRDWRTAQGLSERERAMLDYAEKLTLSSSKIVEGDIDRLRAVGLDDRGVLQVNLCAAFFNYINRVANGLGVGKT